MMVPWQTQLGRALKRVVAESQSQQQTDTILDEECTNTCAKRIAQIEIDKLRWLGKNDPKKYRTNVERIRNWNERPTRPSLET